MPDFYPLTASSRLERATCPTVVEVAYGSDTLISLTLRGPAPEVKPA